MENYDILIIGKAHLSVFVFMAKDQHVAGVDIAFSTPYDPGLYSLMMLEL